MGLKKISVETVPNGYTLDVENNGYFYYSANDLMEGVMYHVGLEIEGACSKENIQDMLVTAMNWKDNKKAVTEIQNLTDEIKTLEHKLNASEQREKEERQRINNIMSELRDAIKSRNTSVTVLSAAIKSVMQKAGRNGRIIEEED